MKEYESDILTVEKEYEPDFFEEKDDSSKFEYTTEFDNYQKDNFYQTEEEPQFEEQSFKKQYDKFDDYSNDLQNSSYEEYEVIRNYTPKLKAKPKKENKEFNKFLDNQYAYTDSTETYIYQRGKEKSTFSSKTRGRIIVYACALIAILLSTLCIVNLVNISTINAANSEIQQEINKVDDKLAETGNKIKDEKENYENNDGDYIDKNQANIASITLIEKSQPQNYESETNFFDRICNFISSLFGG